jgi:hypothetical protein
VVPICILPPSISGWKADRALSYIDPYMKTPPGSRESGGVSDHLRRELAGRLVLNIDGSEVGIVDVAEIEVGERQRRIRVVIDVRVWRVHH